MKKLISAVAILLAVALFPISFSGSQITSTGSSIPTLYLTEGTTISLTANDMGEGGTYQWSINGLLTGITGNCDASTAASFGVEFIGGTTRTLTIKNINSKLNNSIISCSWSSKTSKKMCF